MYKLRFFFDYKSPFSYLALKHNKVLLEEFDIQLVPQPFAFSVSDGFGKPEERTDYQNTKLKLV